MNKVVKKKGDLTGAGKGDSYRVSQFDPVYKKNYDKIFGKKDTLIENRVIERADRKN